MRAQSVFPLRGMSSSPLVVSRSSKLCIVGSLFSRLGLSCTCGNDPLDAIALGVDHQDYRPDSANDSESILVIVPFVFDFLSIRVVKDATGILKTYPSCLRWFSRSFSGSQSHPEHAIGIRLQVKSGMRAFEAATCHERHRGVAISALISRSSPAASGSGSSPSAAMNSMSTLKNLTYPVLQKFKLFKPFKLFNLRLFDLHRLM